MQRIQQKPAKPITANVSYVQMASTSKAHQTKSQTSKENEESTNNDFIVTLPNVTQTLANITASMDKLETKQSPKIHHRK